MNHETPAAIETTNGRLDRVALDLATLIKWAKADAEASTEANAEHQAADDLARVKLLETALQAVTEAYRN